MALIISIICVLIIIGVLLLYRWIVLPKHIDALIEEIQKEELPQLVTGRTGFANNKGIKIAYEIHSPKESNGQTILLISGHSSIRTSIPKHFYQPLVDAGYQLIKYDNRGLGESDWMKDWSQENAYTLEDMASDGMAVLEHLNIPKAHLIGISMGGMIAQTMAIHFHQKVLSLTSIMSTGFWADPELIALTKKWYLNFYAVNFLYGRQLETDAQKMKLYMANKPFLKGKGAYEMDYKGILQKAWYELKARNGFNPKVGEQHTQAIILSGSRYEQLKRLQVPALVIHGSDDPLILSNHSDKYAAMIPNVKKLIVQGMGHDLPLKYMSEIHQAIKQFIG